MSGTCGSCGSTFSDFHSCRPDSGSLDIAWAEVVAVLPRGWFITALRQRTPGSRFSVTAAVGYSETGENVSGFGRSAPDALRALALRLSQPPFSTPGESEGDGG